MVPLGQLAVCLTDEIQSISEVRFDQEEPMAFFETTVTKLIANHNNAWSSLPLIGCSKDGILRSAKTDFNRSITLKPAPS